MYDKNSYSYEARSNVPRIAVPVKARTSPFLIFLVVVFIVAAFVGSGFLGARIAYTLYKKEQGTETTTIVYKNSSDKLTTLSSDELASLIASGTELSPEQVVLATQNSVVEITTESVVYGGFGNKYVTSGAGSGVIIAEDGHIITNYHVVGGAETITVTMYDGTKYSAERVMGDKVSDIAVIKINAETLNYAQIGDSDVLNAGQEVIAIGNPLGSLGGTVTKGVISATNRVLTVDNQEMNLLQIDASVNPGNSGGGLFNMYGALVGVINAKSAEEGIEGIGFAIPINTAFNVGGSLMERGCVEGRVNTAVLDFWEVTIPTPSRPNTGLYVKTNETGTADFATNDYIISVAGTRVSTQAEWEKVLNSKQPRETVEVVFRRSGRDYSVRLTLTQRTDCDR